MRDDDIVIGTWAKSGTNWMQQIVAQLLFDGPEGVYGQEATPWIDFRLAPDEAGRAAAITHRGSSRPTCQ